MKASTEPLASFHATDVKQNPKVVEFPLLSRQRERVGSWSGQWPAAHGVPLNRVSELLTGESQVPPVVQEEDSR
jgi:hypothetical protein